jgi:xylose dehydrogenase (NAD/NADP)
VPVRWGFLGAGAVATRVLAPAVHASAHAELYGAAARDPERAAALRPTGRAFASYDELLAEPDVDAVYVALAHHQHLPWTLAALEAGKHVLCEKPLGLNVAEVDEMTAAAARSGRLLVEALFYRWHPQVRRAEQLVRDGHVGAVRGVDAVFSFHGVAAGNFRLDPQRGGGALYDVGCYPISAALWAFGEPPTSVEARLTRGDTGVDLAADVAVTFGAGTATIHVGLDEADQECLTITGEYDVLDLGARPYTAWFGPDSELRVGHSVLTVPATDPYRVMVDQVSAAIRGEPAYVVPLAETRMVATVIDAAFESARSGGRPVAR